jgi:hypothetical protein
MRRPESSGTWSWSAGGQPLGVGVRRSGGSFSVPRQRRDCGVCTVGGCSSASGRRSWIRQLSPDANFVVLEADRCGHGAAGPRPIRCRVPGVAATVTDDRSRPAASADSSVPSRVRRGCRANAAGSPSDPPRAPDRAVSPDSQMWFAVATETVDEACATKFRVGLTYGNIPLAWETNLLCHAPGRCGVAGACFPRWPCLVRRLGFLQIRRHPPRPAISAAAPGDEAGPPRRSDEDPETP